MLLNNVSHIFSVMSFVLFLQMAEDCVHLDITRTLNGQSNFEVKITFVDSPDL
jgi:hypothetical protein